MAIKNFRRRIDYEVSYMNGNNRDRKYHRNYAYQRKYGITIEEYEVILKTQDGHCLFCSANRSSTGKRLAVDHNHKTGKIRGLLCFKHNTVIGALEQQPGLLDSIVKYLKDNNNENAKYYNLYNKTQKSKVLYLWRLV